MPISVSTYGDRWNGEDGGSAARIGTSDRRRGEQAEQHGAAGVVPQRRRQPAERWPCQFCSAARPVCGNSPRGRRWMKRMSATSTTIFASTAPSVRLEQLVDDAHRHAADERAPQVADAAEDDDHERVDDVGLTEVGADVGQLAERDAGDAGDARAEPERHRVDPRAADAHRPRHRPVLRDGADLEAEPRPLQHEQQQAEDDQREHDDVEAVVGEASASLICSVPLIHAGVSTERLSAEKIERTSCCSTRLTPNVASSVSSGRP